MNCQCENSHCQHQPGACRAEGQPNLRIMMLGAFCSECYQKMPKQYRVNHQDEQYCETCLLALTNDDGSCPRYDTSD